MAAFAGLTTADVCVVSVLLSLALLIWFGRRLVGALLHLLPFVMAPLSTAAAYGLYRIGVSMRWDSPGSPAILVVIILIGCVTLVAIAGWFALFVQVRRLREPQAQSPREKTRANDVRVGSAMIIVVAVLLSVYGSYRAHRPSHQSTVQQLVFSADGTRLYSLDRAGVLKRWDVPGAFESGKWQLPADGEVHRMLVDDEGGVILLLSNTQLNAWDLSDGANARLLATTGKVLAVDAVTSDAFVLLRSDVLELHPYRDIVNPSAKVGLDSAPLSCAVGNAGNIIVGTEDRRLASYRVGGPADGNSAGAAAATIQAAESGLEGLPALALMPRAIRVERSGRYVVVSDRGSGIIVLDLQGSKLDTISMPYVSAQFEVSTDGQLLLPEVSSLMGYDLDHGTTEPLFNRGGEIGAIAVAAHENRLAVASVHDIYLRADSRHYAAGEIWLNGKVELSDLLRLGRGAAAPAPR
jgi:hypothetical protein